MVNDMPPFSLEDVRQMAQRYPTPFYLYDEARMRQTAQKLRGSMQQAGVPGFQNYFAVKALPNPEILKILVQEGMGADVSSVAELCIADMAGLRAEQLMFSSNNTTREEFAEANDRNAIINFDDLSLVRPYLDAFGPPSVACCRYNPGNLAFGGINEAIIGSPKEAKYGMPKDQIVAAYKLLKKAGVKKFGVHTMLLSNELDSKHHVAIAERMFELAVTLAKEVGVQFSFINLGGGLGVPYRPDESEFDLERFAAALAKLCKRYGLSAAGSPRVVMENGRYVTAESGYLITRVQNIKRTHKTYVGVDATMANLMRPGMYGAYHHITVPGKASAPAAYPVDVVGSLCENNDKFAVDRLLPELEIGDYLVIHTAGAHGHAMGFQYNGRLRSAELLLRADGAVRCIRRAETLGDYFATLRGCHDRA